jgi:hypothetical protein
MVTKPVVFDLHLSNLEKGGEPLVTVGPPKDGRPSVVVRKVTFDHCFACDNTGRVQEVSAGIAVEGTCSICEGALKISKDL